jgi:hypothetical protein
MIHCYNTRLSIFFVSNNLFVYCFLSDILYAFLISIMRATYLSFYEASFTLDCEASRAEPNRTERRRTEMTQTDSARKTPTFLKVIHPRCVTDQYLFCDNTVTHNTAI